ncbi:MAG TPA: putative maltokinase [Terriglobia bacterium]|nr:putative maltokinase [Terriglobia bacterium]
MEPNRTDADLRFAYWRKTLPKILPDFLRNQRWFGGKADVIQSVEISDILPLQVGDSTADLCFLRVAYFSSHAQEYALPLKLASAGETKLPEGISGSMAEPENTSMSLRDAMQERDFQVFLLESIRHQAVFRGEAGSATAFSTPALDRLAGASEDGGLEPSLMRVEQSNTSVRYGGRLILKFFRRLEKGVNLDLEIGNFLAEKAQFKNTPPLAGAIEYRRSGQPPITLAILQGFVPNQGDAWRHTLDSLDEYLTRVRAVNQRPRGASVAENVFSGGSEQRVPDLLQELAGASLGDAKLLGRRTAELHLALSSDTSDPDFAPEPFTQDYQRRLADSMTRFANSGIQLLRDRAALLSPETQNAAQQILAAEDSILSRFRGIGEAQLTICRTRLHGDFHLGQALYTGTDFVIIDFEGEPERPLAERRLKRSPLRDVAGMLRSFHYAALTALYSQRDKARAAGEDLESLDLPAWIRQWKQSVSVAFLDAYIHVAEGACFLPRSREELKFLLEVYLLEKAIYELIYELKNRPDWVAIPLEGILELLHSD